MRYLSTIVLLFGAAFAPAGEAPAVRMFTIVPGAEIFLKDDYGALLANDGGEAKPTPRYILAVRATRTVTDTIDAATFAKALAGIPKGSSVILYDSCTVPRSWGLTEGQLLSFEKMIQDAGLIVPQDTMRITCYCEQVSK